MFACQVVRLGPSWTSSPNCDLRRDRGLGSTTNKLPRPAEVMGEGGNLEWTWEEAWDAFWSRPGAKAATGM